MLKSIWEKLYFNKESHVPIFELVLMLKLILGFGMTFLLSLFDVKMSWVISPLITYLLVSYNRPQILLLLQQVPKIYNLQRRSFLYYIGLIFFLKGQLLPVFLGKVLSSLFLGFIWPWFWSHLILDVALGFGLVLLLLSEQLRLYYKIVVFIAIVFSYVSLLFGLEVLCIVSAGVLVLFYTVLMSIIDEKRHTVFANDTINSHRSMIRAYVIYYWKKWLTSIIGLAGYQLLINFLDLKVKVDLIFLAMLLLEMVLFCQFRLKSVHDATGRELFVFHIPSKLKRFSYHPISLEIFPWLISYLFSLLFSRDLSFVGIVFSLGYAFFMWWYTIHLSYQVVIHRVKRPYFWEEYLIILGAIVGMLLW